MHQANEIVELVSRLRVKPLFYLSSASLTSLADFLHGYQYRQMEEGTAQQHEDNILLLFTRWLAWNMGIKESVSWVTLIERKYGEEDGFAAFFSEFDAFLNVRS